jgi:DNA repair protein RadC
MSPSWRVRGVGDTKAFNLKAAVELGRRLASLSPDERPLIASPDDVVNLVGLEMAALEQGPLSVVMLDPEHCVLAIRTVYQGSVNQAQVRAADAIRNEGISMYCRRAPSLSDHCRVATLASPTGRRTAGSPTIA